MGLNVLYVTILISGKITLVSYWNALLAAIEFVP
jgi:hypothetical protein